MSSKAKKPYPGVPQFPDIYRYNDALPHTKPEYPDGPIGEAIDRCHRMNRFVYQYGNLFCGGDHMARFPVHDYLGVRIVTAPTYVRAVEGLTMQQMADQYKIFMQEVAPENAFVNIGLEELKQPEFDPTVYAFELRSLLCDMCGDCWPLKHIYLTSFFPVCPAAATDATRDAMKYLTNERITVVNRMLRKLADMDFAGPVALHYIDLNEPLTAPNGELREYLTLDGIHLTPDAYFRVFEQIKDIISEPPGVTGGPAPEDNFLRMTSRMQALEQYILSHGLMTREKLVDVETALDLKARTTNQLLDDMTHFLPPADLRELAKYIVHYVEDPIDVMRKYSPEAFAAEENRRAELLQFPNNENGGDDK